MKFKKITKYLLLLVVLVSSQIHSQELEKDIKSTIKVLEKLTKKASKKGIDVLKEETTLATAKIFLKHAKWDEENVDVNESLFKRVVVYKKNSQEMAELLPTFEREDIYKMLQASVKNIKKLIKKEIFRQPSQHINLAKVNLVNDELVYEGRPVFLADYTWKPDDYLLNKYFGALGGFFITPSYLVNPDGTINKNIQNKLDAQPSGNIGFIFLNHKTVPKWATAKYGENFKMREDTYTAYDIDHPGAREIQSKLLGNIVPQMADKKYTELGYMLCNEPHFFTQKTGSKKAWASGPVSSYTIEKFKVWLKEKHQKIENLNALWNTSFTSFDEVFIQIPIDTSLKGTAKWYDWSLFNMTRVTAWYQFMKDEIVKNDDDAKVHLKIMPNLWTENKRVHGIDLEALTELSGIIGNDSGAENNYMWGKKPEWEEHYALNWRELCMGYDFMKSVSPNKVNFNTEVHYLSTVKSRDLYLDPAYARATFWLAHIYGLTASQIWYWPRNADGSVFKKTLKDKGYAGSNSQQPRVTNEVAMTMIDLNSNSEEIMAMQRLRKPIRIFYSKTSAINKRRHMDDVFKLYESVHFNGVPIGFATENILNKQEHSLWDVLLITKTQQVTSSEFKAIQSYLDNGGTVLIDKLSLKKNEYGVPYTDKLVQSNGTIVVVNSFKEYESLSMDLLAKKKLLSNVTVLEENELNTKGCVWRVVKNKAGVAVLSVVNVGKTNAKLTIGIDNTNDVICKDIINGIEVSSTPVLKPYEVYFVEVTKK